MNRRVVPFLLTCVVLASGTAHASITPRAQAIVDRYVEATGGADALTKDGRVRVKGRVQAMDLKGTFEQWTQAPDRVLLRMNLGPMRTRTGYDGRVGWVTDLNAKRVRLLEGTELEKIRSSAYFDNEMWARPDQGGGKIVHGSPMFRDQDEYQSIEVTPPVGPTRKLWFSKKTGLLVRVLSRQDHHESDHWLSGYKKLAGRMRYTVQDGIDPALHVLLDKEREPERFQVDSVQAGLVDDSTFFSPPASVDGPVAWHGKRSSARVPFLYGSRHVWIKASINGAPPAEFMLDTGASITFLDKDYAEQIGLKPEGEFGVQGMGGMAGASFVRLRTLRVGGAGGPIASAKKGAAAVDEGVTVRDIKAAILEFGRGSRYVLWRKMSGVIGYDFLSRFVVELDYDRQVVTFRDPKTYEYTGKGATLDMKVRNGLPFITASLDEGCSGDFLLDVGNSFGVIVHGSLARSCGMLRSTVGRKQVKVLTGGVGASFSNWMCRIDSLGMGPYEVHEPIASLSLSTQGMVGSKDVAGNLGNGVLERFRCVYDYSRGKFHLEPGARYPRADRYSRAGALFLRLEYKVIVVQILHGSPADEAGLQYEDEILTIDGRPATRYTAEEMDRMFVEGEPGATHKLKILREGKTSEITITLRDVI